MNINQEKLRIRKQLRSRRKLLGKQQRESCALKIKQRLSKHPLYQRAEKIGIYFSFPEEITLAPFIKQAIADKKRLFAPVIIKHSNQKSMTLIEWLPNNTLITNQYGISEPTHLPKISKHAPVDSLDLILLPLVGYDHQGFRLGMGGGYYDRYLAKTQNQTLTTRIGIAHSCQFHSNIPNEVWDKKLHYLINENETLSFSDQ